MSGDIFKSVGVLARHDKASGPFQPSRGRRGRAKSGASSQEAAGKQGLKVIWPDSDSGDSRRIIKLADYQFDSPPTVA